MVPAEEPQTEKKQFVSNRTSDILDVTQVSECKCGKPRVRIRFRNGFSITVHDDGSFTDWTGETG